MLVTKNVAVHPIHLERRCNGDDFLSNLAKCLKQVANRHVRTIRAHQVLELDTYKLSVLFQETIRLWVYSQELRRYFLQYCINKFLG